jgi:hypothetical protein
MLLPAHHSPHWLLVQLVPVMGHRMAYLRSLAPVALLLVRMTAFRPGPRLVSPSVRVEAAEQAREPLG